MTTSNKYLLQAVDLLLPDDSVVHRAHIDPGCEKKTTAGISVHKYQRQRQEYLDELLQCAGRSSMHFYRSGRGVGVSRTPRRGRYQIASPPTPTPTTTTTTTKREEPCGPLLYICRTKPSYGNHTRLSSSLLHSLRHVT